MHTLLFLDPGHFHAALTLRVPQARAADEVFVYAREGAELRDFLALVERFNRRAPHPTRWRPVVTTSDDPLARLVDAPALFGAFRDDGPAIEQESVHHLEKLVDGAPLKRPWWFFDVRVQGSGPVDIPTHVVDQAQWLVDGDASAPALVSTRAWPTRAHAEAFRRITGEAGFLRETEPFIDGDALSYRCNAELGYRIGRVTASAATRWNLSPLPGGGDTSHSVAHGTRADIRLEQSARTGHRRKVFLEPRTDAAGVARVLLDTVRAWQAGIPGVEVVPAGPGTYEVTVPPPLDGGHETHFARVLDEFLSIVDDHSWPTALAERTLAKYTLLAEAAARTGEP